MNKIYKVIWSQVTNSFIAVSELTSSRGKTKSTTNSVLNIKDKNASVFKLTKAALLSSMVFAFSNNAMAAENVEAADLTVTGNATFNGVATFNGGITANGKNVATSEQIDNLNTQLATKADSASVSSLSDKVTTLENQKANATDVSNLTNKVNSLENQKANATDVSNLTNKVNSLETNKADKSTLADLTNTVTNNQNQFTALKTLFDSLGVVTEYNGIKYFRVKSTETDARATGSNSLAAGPKSDAKAEKSVTVGYDAYAEDSANKGIAIGNKSQVGSKVAGGELTYDGASEYVIGDGSSSIAIGDSAVARGNSNIALGKDALTTNKDALSLFSSNNIAVGTESKTIAASNAIAFGNQAVAGGKGRVADSSIAIGDNAKALDLYATAIGRLAEADKYGLAIGSSARAAGEGSVALGQESFSNSQNTVAIGKGAQALPWRTISIGQDAGKGQAADIVGDKNEQINIGVKAGENVDGQLNIGIGQSAGSNVLGKGNIALGQNAGQFVGGTNSSVGNNIAIGTNANRYATNTDVVETTAIGFGAQASGTRTVALGKETKATAIDSVAIGTSSQANGASSVAIGLDAIANGSDNLALGHSSKADTKAGTGYLTGKQSSTVVSVGNDTLQRRIVNVADGADDQDAVTVAQLKRVSDDVYNKVNTQINNLSLAAGSGINYDAIPRTATENSITLSKDGKKTIIGSVAAGTKDDDAVNLAQLNQVVEANKVHYFSTKVNGSTLGNYNNNGAEGDIALAVGMDVRAVGDRSVTVGNRSTAESRGGIAIGALYDGSATLDDNDAQNAVHTVAKSSTGQPFVYNMAIGAGASSEGNNSIAIGSLAKTSTKQQNTASPDRAIALGYFAAASDVKANAIGDRATSSGQKANAFGSQATATAISATAIGTVAQAQGENSIAMGTHQRVTGINSGSIGYAGAFDEEVKGRSISGSHAGNATQVSGSGTYSVGNTNSAITSNESGIFGNDNFVQAKENVRVVGNTNTISKRATPTVNTGAPPITTSLKDVYITGHNNQVDSAEKPLENSKNLFVVGAANKIGTVLNGDKALTITDSYVIGTNNTINTSNTASDSLDPSNPAENGAEAADKNKVGKGFFILGNNVTATKENSVYLGTDSAYIDNASISAQLGTAYNSQVINGKTYNYAGGAASGVVTVGHSELTRRIQGVAAGLVNATSTDAINGSQLYAHTRPLGFAADNTTGLNNQDGEATATTNLIQRASGQAIEILGGADKDNLSDKNIGVNVKDTNTIEVKLAKNINLGSDGSLTIGNTKVGDQGITINAGAAGENVTLTQSGLNNGGNNIVNVKGNLAPTYNTDDMTIGEDGKPTTTAATKPTKSQAAPTPAEAAKIYNNAATVGDVLNSGWNLQGNGTAVDFVKPYDTVNFVNGANTAVNVTASEDGKTSEVIVNVTGLPISFVNEAGDTLVKVGDKFYKTGDVENGKPKTGAKEQTPAGTSLVGGDGNKTPQTLANVKSSIEDGSNKSFKEKLAAANTSNPNNAVNVSDLKTAVDDLIGPSDIGGFGLKDKQGAEFKQSLGTTAQITGDKNINTKVIDAVDADGNSTGNKALEVSLNNDITIGKDGKPGSIGVAGQDGKDGVSIKGDTGKDGEPGEATITVGRDGKDGDAGIDGKVGVNGKDGSAVVLNGKDGSIGLNGKDGKDGLSLKSADGAQGVDGTNGADGLPGKDGKTRIVYTPVDKDGNPVVDPKTNKPVVEEVATLNDGLIFTGNNEELNRHKLNTVVKVVGEGVNKDASAAFQSAAGNINVVADKKDTLEIQLNRELNNLSTANFVGYKDAKDEKGKPITIVDEDAPKTTVNNNGITITPKDGKDGVDGNVVSVTKDGLNNGGNQIVNVDSGLKDADGNPVDVTKAEGDILKNAVNVSDLKTVATDAFGLKDKEGNEFKQNLGTTAQITGDKNINTKVIDAVDANGKPTGNKALEVSLNNDITIGGKDGKDGSIGVAGKDGKDGVSIKGNGTITAGRDGVDGVDGSIGAKGKDGASVVLNGKDGSIGLTGPKGADGKPGANASIQVKDGAEGVNGTGKDGLPGENGQTRIVYETKDKDGKTITEQLANLNDGLIFTGNNEDTLNRHKLNTVVKVQGEGVDKAASDKFKSAKGNINVKANGAGTLEVQLAKDLDLTRDGSVTTGNTTINNDGLTIKDGPRITQDGINANNTRITNVAPGVDGTDAVNVNQLKGAVNHLDNKINRNKREARSGIAGSNAAAALPQAYLPGKSMVAVSAGTFKREGAIALGYSRSSDNGKVILKLQGNANTRGDFGAGVGLGYQW